MKIKNKKRLIVLSTLYIVGYLYFCIFGGINYGMKISDHTALEMIIVSLGIPVVVRNLSITIFIWIILSVFSGAFYYMAVRFDWSKVNQNNFDLPGNQSSFHFFIERYCRVDCWWCCGWTFYNVDHLCRTLFFSWCRHRNHIFRKQKTGRLNSYEAFSDILTEDEFEQWKK